MAKDKLGVGLIGANIHAGWGGSVHGRVLQALPNYEIAAVCTAHRETAEEAARHFGTPNAFDDYNALISCPEVDVVAVVVRVPAHHAMVMAALKAGKHVFCEWPLAANVAEAEEITALARSGGGKYVVGLQARAEPKVLELKRLLAEGYVGDILTCRLTHIFGGVKERESRRGWQIDPALGANTLTIPAGHALDTFRFCVGEFAEVSAQLSTQVPQWRLADTGEIVTTRSPDNILLSGKLADGAVASVQVSNVAYHGSGWSLEVYGSEGTIIAGGTGQVQTGPGAMRGAKGTSPTLEEMPVAEGEPVPESLQGTPAANVARLYQRLAAGIVDGKPIEPNFETALGLHRLLDAIERSSKEGRRASVS